uniref:Uncharacterized protein n=1 Tax=Calidris pygmaea TaxID=425635 RepID=A0A8C3JZT7_9CHAR
MGVRRPEMGAGGGSWVPGMGAGGGPWVVGSPGWAQGVPWVAGCPGWVQGGVHGCSDTRDGWRRGVQGWLDTQDGSREESMGGWKPRMGAGGRWVLRYPGWLQEGVHGWLEAQGGCRGSSGAQNGCGRRMSMDGWTPRMVPKRSPWVVGSPGWVQVESMSAQTPGMGAGKDVHGWLDTQNGCRGSSGAQNGFRGKMSMGGWTPRMVPGRSPWVVGSPRWVQGVFRCSEWVWGEDAHGWLEAQGGSSGAQNGFRGWTSMDGWTPRMVPERSPWVAGNPEWVQRVFRCPEWVQGVDIHGWLDTQGGSREEPMGGWKPRMGAGRSAGAGGVSVGSSLPTFPPVGVSPPPPSPQTPRWPPGMSKRQSLSTFSSENFSDGDGDGDGDEGHTSEPSHSATPDVGSTNTDERPDDRSEDLLSQGSEIPLDAPPNDGGGPGRRHGGVSPKVMSPNPGGMDGGGGGWGVGDGEHLQPHQGMGDT